MSRTVHRFRLAAVCLALAVLSFLQEPGRVAADTKLDLAVDPIGFLGRALHLWDDTGFFGQVQNQAYGYLWPVGPFFAVLHSAGVVPWVGQRLWWSVVMVVGFLGFVLLARHLGVQRPGPRIVAGLGYVLSARMVTELTALSSEAWPMAVAPWLVLPLVIGARRGSPRRWAALSGVAFLMTGAINAVASVALLPLGAVFLATREWTARTKSLLLWWSAALALASAWWLIPLLLMGRYSPPFLDWIEGAAVTTGQNDPTSVLRGTSHWVPYLVGADGPVWPAGWSLVAEPVVVAGSAVVCLLGFAGLLLRAVPERAWLVVVLSVGVVAAGLGHIGASGTGGLAADGVRDLLDGALAPLRNLHKFQPLVTLPLMVGLGHLLTVAPDRLRALARGARWPVPGERLAGGRPAWAAATSAVAAGAVAVAALPVLTGAQVGGRSFAEIPGYWREAAAWLNERVTGRALVVPAAQFGVYIWGRSQDEPLQALDTQSWAVRDAVPLSSAGNIRLLDEFERHFASGTGSPGLAAALARSGVRYLVLRNDLNTRAADAALPVLVHQSLDQSPGISLAAAFGPTLQALSGTTRIADAGLQRTYPAVEVYAVQPDPRVVAGRVALRDASEVTHFSGGSEALVDLAAGGVLGAEPAIMAGDEVPAPSRALGAVTDTYRRAEVNFGAASDHESNTLTDAEPMRAERAVHDYHPVDPAGRQVEARLEGASAVTASSAGASPFALRGRSPGAQPWAALDGDPSTAWVSGDLVPGVGQWWRVDFDVPVAIPQFEVQLLGDVRVGQQAMTLRATTSAGSRVVDVAATAEPQRISMGPGAPARFLRLELLAVEGGGPGQGFGLSEVRIPGVSVSRPLLTPSWRADAGIVLAARTGERGACAAADTAVVCDPRLARPGEDRAGLDRVVDLQSGGSYRLTARVRPRPGRALDAYLAAPAGAIRVQASSQLGSDPAVRGQAAADQQARTTWIASPLDPDPTLTVRLPRRQTVTGMVLRTAADAPASRPLGVTVEVEGARHTLFTDLIGRVELPPVRTDRLRISFDTTTQVRSLDSGTGTSRLLPVGVTELEVLGGPDRRMLQPAESAVAVPCGFGPSLLVDDEPVLTRVAATAGDIVDGALARAEGCGGTVTLTPGVHRIRMAPSAEWLVEEVYLTPDRSAAPPAPRLPQIRSWSATHRELALRGDSRPLLLETTENFNDGWRATVGSVELVPYRVDGWRQAFLVPAGTTGTVQLTFWPDRLYRAGLLLGLLAVLGLLALVAARSPGSHPAPVGPRRARAAVVLAPALAAVLVGGAVGLLAVVLVVALAAGIPRRWPGVPVPLIARSVGLAGLAASLAMQAAAPWPSRLDLAGSYDVVAILGPAMGLAAMAIVGWAVGAPGAGSAARGPTS